MNLQQAQRLAERIATELAPFCERVEIAGSIRRRRETVGDIDLVCLPKVGGRAAILERCKRTAFMEKQGSQYVVFRLANGVQIDLWFAQAAGGDLFKPEPSNWGMLLLSRTGSVAHNLHLCTVAHQRGLHFHPHRGVERGADVVASESEEEVFSALGLAYIAPEARER